MPDDWGLLEPLGVHAASTSDDAVLTALVDVERALLRAWGRVRNDDTDIEVAASLTAASLDRDDLRAGAREGGVPVIPLVTQLRAQADARSAGAGERVHRGATSQDILDSALVLVAQRALNETRGSLVSAGTALAVLARGEQDTVSIARTLGQHAAGSTMGIVCAGWLDGISSAIEVIDRTACPVQLGGAVGTGEGFERLDALPETTESLRAALAEELGLADPGRSWHTERTPVLHIVDAAALVAAALGRVGRDVSLLARTDIAELVLGATGGSSVMPHKRNPVDSILLTANGLRAPGLLSTAHVAALSYDARPAGEWHAEWQAVRGLLRIAVESASAAARLLASLSVDRAALDTRLAHSSSLVPNPALLRERSSRIVGAALTRFHTSTPESSL